MAGIMVGWLCPANDRIAQSLAKTANGTLGQLQSAPVDKGFFVTPP